MVLYHKFLGFQLCAFLTATSLLTNGCTKGIKNFKLDLKREGDKTRLPGVKSGSVTQMFDGQCASEAVWSALLVEVGDRAMWQQNHKGY